MVVSTVTSVDPRPGAFLCAVCKFSQCQVLSRISSHIPRTFNFRQFWNFKLVVGVSASANGLVCLFKWPCHYPSTCLVALTPGYTECRRSRDRKWMDDSYVFITYAREWLSFYLCLYFKISSPKLIGKTSDKTGDCTDFLNMSASPKAFGSQEQQTAMRSFVIAPNLLATLMGLLHWHKNYRGQC